MKKILSISFFGIIIVAGIFVGTLVSSNAKTNNVVNSFSETKEQQSSPGEDKESSQIEEKEASKAKIDSEIESQRAEEVIGTPKHISIPSINVDTSIEQVGQDEKGNMDVPKTDITVGWYKLGFKPGEKGSAVFAGHLDKKDGSPAVFWKVSELKAGDKIITTDSNGKSYTFTVTHSVEYPYDALPLKEIFGKSDKANLNLITCKGDWNSSAHIYSHRLVVYSQRD